MSDKQIALISIFHNIHNSLSTFTLLLGSSPNPRWCRHLGSEILFLLHYRGLPLFLLIIQLRELEFYYHTHFSHLLTLSNGSLVNQNTCGITQCWCSEKLYLIQTSEFSWNNFSVLWPMTGNKGRDMARI